MLYYEIFCTNHLKCTETYKEPEFVNLKGKYEEILHKVYKNRDL